MPSRSLWLDALLGAMVTTILGVVPFSELAGGFVAGYLHGRRGVTIGALSGVFAAVPKAGLSFVAMALLGATSTESVGGALVQFLVLSAAMAVFLGAVGALAGYLGVYYYRNRQNRPDSTTRTGP